MNEIIILTLDDIYTLAGGGEVSCVHEISGKQIKIMSEGRYELIYRRHSNVVPCKVTEVLA